LPDPGEGVHGLWPGYRTGDSSELGQNAHMGEYFLPIYKKKKIIKYKKSKLHGHLV
jgi:hypothetical protein